MVCEFCKDDSGLHTESLVGCLQVNIQTASGYGGKNSLDVDEPIDLSIPLPQ